jgi:RNA polymerase sigma-70 factor (ECF subfamily)
LAVTTLVERHGSHVRRVLCRILGGNDSEMADIFQEVMLNAWGSIDGLTRPRALKSWLTQIAIFTARKAIRRRHRRRWLSFFDRVPEPEVTWAGADLREAAACVYKIFDRMPVDERIPFALRLLEGLDLEATAAACGMSVATVRRRLVRAESRFFKLARQFEALTPWLEAR